MKPAFRKPHAAKKSTLLSSMDGAPIIKNDFGNGKIIAHNYACILGLVRSEVENVRNDNSKK